ncbi:MAG: PEP-CTERM sorting domain-containing protein [Candidatus Accumulibacter meliphilus]|jgi:hypothetical protein|uniref:PEP-CTERM sorting domain-containing protein n=1 Tax=Candidatus Accumulibacter meliphilus TaxID=2211374 RepID=A0A369XIZ2_9PROT|nr:MAG: PEP-CTERM sorting domain-containing protein [Candidatus Accumulibacter meliphilus]
MKRKMTIKKLSATLGGLFLMLATTGAQAISLDALFAAGTIQVNDKLFSDWQLKELVHSSDAPRIDLTQIEVTGISGNPLNPGLDFAIDGGGLQAGGQAGDFDVAILRFEFKVTVLDPRMRIKDSELSISGGWVASPDTLLGIEETVCSSANCEPAVPDEIAWQRVWVDTLLNEFKEQDVRNFAPQQEIWVDQFVYVASWDGGPAAITKFQKFFSQEVVSVPEPGSLAMVALGLIGVGFGRRRLG